MTKGKATTAEVNARLWSAAAHDWADWQEGQVRPVYLEAFARLGMEAGVRYLDAGCGAGMAVALAVERGAAASGADAAPALLQIARTRAPTADFRQADLQSLPFEDRAFDTVTGFNAFQYASDPVAALREAKRVTRRGGQVLIMTWGEPAGMAAASLVSALAPLLPTPPPGTPGPFALSDSAALTRFAEAAGLQPMSIFETSSPFRYPDLDTSLRALGSSGVAARAVEAVGRAAVDEAHAAALAPFRLSDGSYEVDARFRSLISRA